MFLLSLAKLPGPREEGDMITVECHRSPTQSIEWLVQIVGNSSKSVAGTCPSSTPTSCHGSSTFNRTATATLTTLSWRANRLITSVTCRVQRVAGVVFDHALVTYGKFYI